MAVAETRRARRQETPMVFVRAIVSAYQTYGVDPAAALASARITPAQLRRPNGRIDSDQLETLSSAAMQELDDEALGWFSRRLPWGTHGMLCRASLGAPTLASALRRWCRHHRLLTDDMLLTFTPETVDGVAGARLSIEERRTSRRPAVAAVEGAMASAAEVREFSLLTTLRYVQGYACWLINSRLPLRDVTFPFAAPRHESVYPLLFPGPVRFGAKSASMLIEGRYLAIAPRRDERALDKMLRRALPLTVRPYQRDRFLVERVRQQLAGASGSSATGVALAAALHLSVRSLHRQLAREGAALQTLKDETRQQRATELLRRTSLPIKQVALAAGFASEKSFARAFRQWTGESPTEHRSKSEALLTT